MDVRICRVRPVHAQRLLRRRDLRPRRGDHLRRRHRVDVLTRGVLLRRHDELVRVLGTDRDAGARYPQDVVRVPLLHRLPRARPRGSTRDDRGAQARVHLHPDEEGVRHGLAPEAREGGAQEVSEPIYSRVIRPRRNCHRRR